MCQKFTRICKVCVEKTLLVGEGREGSKEGWMAIQCHVWPKADTCKNNAYDERVV